MRRGCPPRMSSPASTPANFGATPVEVCATFMHALMPNLQRVPRLRNRATAIACHPAAKYHIHKTTVTNPAHCCAGSGIGSEPSSTAVLRPKLVDVIKKYGIKSMVKGGGARGTFVMCGRMLRIRRAPSAKAAAPTACRGTAWSQMYITVPSMGATCPHGIRPIRGSRQRRVPTRRSNALILRLGQTTTQDGVLWLALRQDQPI